MNLDLLNFVIARQKFNSIEFEAFRNVQPISLRLYFWFLIDLGLDPIPRFEIDLGFILFLGFLIDLDLILFLGDLDFLGFPNNARRRKARGGRIPRPPVRLCSTENIYMESAEWDAAVALLNLGNYYKLLLEKRLTEAETTHAHLHIPRAAVEGFGIRNRVITLLDSDGQTWEMELRYYESGGGALKVTRNWQEFRLAHNLRKNDTILIYQSLVDKEKFFIGYKEPLKMTLN
ncbi:hypothetical protein Vadar_022288 [Vaccinium darrowii]|uniref:Uncharacterized protein n=1 Tax=Vaccinium darrowii TaxID=229202 RepID=A0ACB7ZE11_9ERIC|nr:hypothetical protein Vadar_022288 [Vaccinium darrowii]